MPFTKLRSISLRMVSAIVFGLNASIRVDLVDIARFAMSCMVA